jgi:FHA domain/Double zinc ribbon
MTVSCPVGHSSSTTDYCDQCGRPIEVAAPPLQPSEVLPAVDDEDTSPAPRQEPCPECGAPRSGDDSFCEQCGFDFTAPARVASNGVRWEAVVTADRSQFERFPAAGISFPDDFAEKRFRLDGAEIRIGRSGDRSGEPAPEIDLARMPQDPGISRRHAVLERQEDGSYAVRDVGSTNGTSVNDEPLPGNGNNLVPLADGDRIQIGAWTTITVCAR